MTNLLNTGIPTEHIIKGNAPLQLNDPTTIWVIKSGSMAVFAVLTVNGTLQGMRRFLFDVKAGDGLFGVASSLEGVSHKLIAVAYEESHLLNMSMIPSNQPVATLDRRQTGIIAKLMQPWSDRLCSVFKQAKIPLAVPAPKSPADLPECLHQFHTDFLRCLHQLDQIEIKTRSHQFEKRLELKQKVAERALEDLTAAFRPREAEFFQEGTPLLIAAGAVGKALNINIRPPARSEDISRVKEPLDAIARASRIRTRRVILSGAWWRSDCGPLLAYMEDGDCPVALLPVGSDRYDIFDPTQRLRIPLTVETAQQISPIAYMFYRPLPEQVLKSMDVFKFASHGQLRDILTILILGSIVSLLGMLIPQATSILIDKAIPDANRGLLFQLALGLLAVSFGSTLFSFVQGNATIRVQTFTNAYLQSAVWDRLLKLPVSFYRKFSTGDLQSRVSAINQIRQILSNRVLRTLLSGFFALFNLVLLFFYSSQLALVALALAFFNLLVTVVFAITSRKQMMAASKAMANRLGLEVQLIGGVSKIRVAEAEERAFAYWSKRYSQSSSYNLKTQALNDGIILFNTAMSSISSMVVYALAVMMILQTNQMGTAMLGGIGFTTGSFLAFNVAFGTFLSGATSLSNTIVDIMDISIMWKRAEPILKELPEVNGGKGDPGRLSGAVKLDRVTFRYRKDGPLTLDKVSLEAKAGESIALVGPSGSGKSTVVRMLLGFEQPEQGAVFFDGQELSGLDVSAVRRQLGVVLQNGRLNNASIFENISAGALVTMDEVWEAARMAGFNQDVEQMPMGMHTVVSEGGSNLSGGQRQRLLIARALVLKPKILIFDEATSALDNRTQAIVSESLDQLQVTRIVIAHRLSTIRNADRIYVLAAGQVVQQGSFDQLMQQKGLFANLMARQML